MNASAAVVAHLKQMVLPSYIEENVCNEKAAIAVANYRSKLATAS